MVICKAKFMSSMSQKSFSNVSERNFPNSTMEDMKMHETRLVEVSQTPSSVEILLGEAKKIEESFIPTVYLDVRPQTPHCSVFHNYDANNSFCEAGQSTPTRIVETHNTFREALDESKLYSSTLNNESSNFDQFPKHILREKYSPRILVPSAVAIAHETTVKNQSTGFDKGEFPQETTQIKLGDDNPREGAYRHSQLMKNYVVDYRNLRKSGYFLNYNQKKNPDKLSILDSNNVNFTTSKANMVDNWINSLPDPSDYHVESDDAMGEHEVLSHTTSNVHFLQQFSSEEERFKRMLLYRGRFIKYTSQPGSTLTHEELEVILDAANEKLYNYLTKMHESWEKNEYEYVSGTIKLPGFLKKDEKQDCMDLDAQRGDPLIKKISRWIGAIFNGGEGIHPSEATCVNNTTERMVILEPYQGPVVVNGATIESGSAKLELGKGLLGTIVEEVKAALQAINEALRHISSTPKNSTKNIGLQQSRQEKEDPEIIRLTEMLQSKGFRKKSTFRTVFGLRNSEKIPSYAFAIRRRRPQARYRRSIIRAVNGWIQRKNIRDSQRQRHVRVLAVDQRPRPLREDQQIDRLRPGVITGVMSAIRSVVPFQLTPAFPVYPIHGQRNQSVEQLRFPQMRSRDQSPLVIPSRYHIVRNGSRVNMKTKYRKTRQVHPEPEADR